MTTEYGAVPGGIMLTETQIGRIKGFIAEERRLLTCSGHDHCTAPGKCRASLRLDHAYEKIPFSQDSAIAAIGRESESLVRSLFRHGKGASEVGLIITGSAIVRPRNIVGFSGYGNENHLDFSRLVNPRVGLVRGDEGDDFYLLADELTGGGVRIPASAVSTNRPVEEMIAGKRQTGPADFHGMNEMLDVDADALGFLRHWHWTHRYYLSALDEADIVINPSDKDEDYVYGYGFDHAHFTLSKRELMARPYYEKIIGHPDIGEDFYNYMSDGDWVFKKTAVARTEKIAGYYGFSVPPVMEIFSTITSYSIETGERMKTLLFDFGAMFRDRGAVEALDRLFARLSPQLLKGRPDIELFREVLLFQKQYMTDRWPAYLMPNAKSGGLIEEKRSVDESCHEDVPGAMER